MPPDRELNFPVLTARACAAKVTGKSAPFMSVGRFVLFRSHISALDGRRTDDLRLKFVASMLSNRNRFQLNSGPNPR
jgi:hypothetical protein